jgi:hypothetical protein
MFDRLVGHPFRVALTTAVLFAAIQIAAVGHGEMGPACVRWLTGPDPEAHAYTTWASYGVPLEFLRIVQEGCFGDRSTSREFWVGRLIFDVFSAGLIGSLVVLVPRWLTRRVRSG